MATVSVIVPVYQAERYLSACVESILQQSFQDFEIILVDDGSPDGSGKICDEYAAKEPRIRVIHQENQGQAAARNHALTMARGKFLCFVDSDDLIHPKMLELLYGALEKSGAPMAMCQMLERAECPEDFDRPREPQWQVFSMDENTLLTLYDREEYPGWVGCAKLIRKDIVERYPFTPGRVYEDNEAVCRWLIAAGRLAWTREALYFYRTNPDSTTQRKFSLKKLDYLWALRSIIRFYHGLGYKKLRERFCDRYAEAVYHSYWAAKDELHELAAAEQIQKDARKLFGLGGVPMTQRQFERLADILYPRLGRLYGVLSRRKGDHQ